MTALRTLAAVTLAATSLSLTSPAAFADRTYKVDMTAQARISGTSLKVTMSGTPIGRCTGVASVTGNGASFKAKCPGKGRIVVAIKFGRDQSHGTWRVTSGTGDFKGGSASGRYTGNISKLRFHMTGTARY